jgi:hypothetical protein
MFQEKLKAPIKEVNCDGMGMVLTEKPYTKCYLFHFQ